MQPETVKMHGRIHGLKSGGRIMSSARNEAPRGGVWGGGAPSPPENRSGEGAMPLPDFLFTLLSSKRRDGL